MEETYDAELGRLPPPGEAFSFNEADGGCVGGAKGVEVRCGC